jgi:hypothetical protein
VITTGGNLNACMALCPSSPPIVYKDCIASCAKRCPQSPGAIEQHAVMMKADDETLVRDPSSSKGMGQGQNTGASSPTRCPTSGPGNKTLAQTSCPVGWSCELKTESTGACHFEYPANVPPHRENCFGCRSSSGGRAGANTACEPNLPTVPMSESMPNVLIVGDSISHGYFPVLVEALNGTLAQLQHAPSNTGRCSQAHLPRTPTCTPVLCTPLGKWYGADTRAAVTLPAGALEAGVHCFNITTLLGATGTLPQPWDLIVFNFGLHDTREPTPPPAGGGVSGSPSLDNYMELLRQYTALALHSGQAKKVLWASTTPFMGGNIWPTLEQMNANASQYMRSVGVPIVDFWTPIVQHCGPKLPYVTCDICSGSTPGHPVKAASTPHFTRAGYQLLVDALIPAMKSVLKPA